jgi:arylsulfatase A-like enzyme
MKSISSTAQDGLPPLARREFLTAFGKGIGAAACSPGIIRPILHFSSRFPQEPQPNIVLILADDMGYADFGLQGCKDVPTPHIDSLAAKGIRFTDGYVSCPVCAPTRAGLMTGRYQQRFGFETNPGPEAYADENFGLPRAETTMAERLKSAGYATGMVGKWHLGYKRELQPTERGFDEFFGFLSGANNYLSDKRRGASRNPILRGSREVQERDYLTDAFGREAVAFIERHHDNPFFLYLAFNAVHAPLEPPEESLQRFAGIKDDKRRTFAAMLAALDDNVGRVLEALRRKNLEENTIIVFLSDNGGPTPQTTASNLPLRGVKGQVFEGGIRVPFIAQWKGRWPAGRVERRPVIQLDVAPTLLAAAGVEVEKTPAFDGVDLGPYLSGKIAAPPHEVLFWRFNNQHAVRRGEWKLVRTRSDDKAHLYNLADDIGETIDLADRETGKHKELEAAWAEWNARLMAPRWRREDSRTREAAKPTARRADRADSLAERFRQFDRNSDGKLTPDEFPRPEVFMQMDKNKDGVVTLEEAKSFYGRRRNGKNFLS